MINFLVDSDIIIWYLKGREKETKLLEELFKNGHLFMSVITITEIRAGLEKDQPKIIKKLQEIFTPISLDPKIAELAGALKQKYQINIADMLIAASSIIAGAVLVTYNRKHFPMPQIKLYKI